jgi:hypothetical protein
MGILSIFKKIGGGIVDAGEVVADIADVPFATQLVAMIPIAGPALAIAMEYVNEAEEVFSDQAKSGADKRAFALSRIESALIDGNLDSTRARALLELAVLLNSNEAILRAIINEEDADGE